MDFLKLKKITKNICIFAVLILVFVLAGEAKADLLGEEEKTADEELGGRAGCICSGLRSEDPATGKVGDEAEREAESAAGEIEWGSLGSCRGDDVCQERCEGEASARGVDRESVRGECQEVSVRDTARGKLKKISVSDPSALVGTVLRAVLGLTGSIALLMFVYGGFLWLTSGGSPDKIKKAQGILVWATLGLTLIFASYAIVDKILLTFAS